MVKEVIQALGVMDDCAFLVDRRLAKRHCHGSE